MQRRSRDRPADADHEPLTVPNAYDMLYGLGLAVTSPVWALLPKARAKVSDALNTRMAHLPPRVGSSPCVMIHAVSLGELNAARGLIELIRDHVPGVHLIVTTTTTAGNDRAIELYAQRRDTTVLRFPLDFTAPIARMLDGQRPDVVVLMELELWPNFMRQCEARKIPVMIANGRITPPSFGKYRKLGRLIRPMFASVAIAAVQEQQHAEQFTALGVPAERVKVLGTMKFDTAQVADHVDGDRQLAAEMGIDVNAPLLVCGSTGPGEESLLLDSYSDLLQTHNKVQLAIVPRKPERFDEVAQLIADRGFRCIRRSGKPAQGSGRDVFLGDTLGELRKFYSLASVVVVGRTLLDLGPKQRGSDMIEPAALAKPVIVGPWTQNFEEPMRVLLESKGIVQLGGEAPITLSLRDLLNDVIVARAMGLRAQDCVRRSQGSARRHLDLLLPLLTRGSTV